MAVAQCTEWRRHGPYSDEATWWLWRAFFNEVFSLLWSSAMVQGMIGSSPA
jgi:hypothetical protein